MSDRKRTERLLKEFVRGAAATTAADDERVKQLFDGIIEAVKEEISKPEPNKPSFDEFVNSFVEKLSEANGMDKEALWASVDPSKPGPETVLQQLEIDRIHDILKNVGVTTREAIDNFTTNMAELNKVAAFRPQLIQGYTAEQWQEIIDGEYLCEFSDATNGYSLGKLYLPPNVSKNIFILAPQYPGGEKEFTDCRPAQIKGVMRPIFAKPVDVTDSNSLFVFFDSVGNALHDGLAAWTYCLNHENRVRVAKYIEV